ncbi:ESX secretion-associated protein EspG [Actinosynnema sp. NPDC020468]|uniref:ESX secretion-associated protein EspG n=1 Tax=Actinosynnema sp. NPDC020468 TaxID=3154488 RepID=UPI0033E230A9
MTNATLSAAAFRAAWDHLDLGAMPIVLHVDDDAAWADLTACGLARGDEVDPWLGSALKLIANPPRSGDLRLGIGSGAVRALAASAGNGAVLAVLAGGTLAVTGLDHDDLASALVGVLPVADDGTVGAPDLRGQFGAAVVDASGRRRRAPDVVDFHGPAEPVELRGRVAELIDQGGVGRLQSDRT